VCVEMGMGALGWLGGGAGSKGWANRRPVAIPHYAQLARSAPHQLTPLTRDAPRRF
jgi:hypothetical protein